MKIKAFDLLAESVSEDHYLKNCDVVIDGDSYFYNIYKDSGLPFAFGCECDKIAEYARECLRIFQNADITCYFMFKGDIRDTAKGDNKNATLVKYYEPGPTKEEFFEPLFTEEVYKQVLQEMDMSYAVCTTETIKQCIALARHLECPVISDDITFCFSDIPYINSDSLTYNDADNSIECRKFELSTLLTKYSLPMPRMLHFILLRDEECFPEGTFRDFFRHCNIPLSHYKRNVGLLIWLGAQATEESISGRVFDFVNETNKELFSKKLRESTSLVNPQVNMDISANFLRTGRLHANRLEGIIATGKMPGEYINLHLNNIFKHNCAIQDPDFPDALFSAIGIIKLAYSLSVVKESDRFTVHGVDEVIHTVATKNEYNPLHELKETIQREGINCDSFHALFEYTLRKRFTAICVDSDNIPKLLFVALIWCAEKCNYFTSSEVFSIILSYTMLNVVLNLCTENCVTLTAGKLPKFSPTHHEGITSTDSLLVTAVLAKYFEMTDQELIEIFDTKILHPLVEFQYCFQHFNYLNTLCGMPYQPTEYSKVYNATFVYRVLYVLKTQYNDNYIDFMNGHFKFAPGIAAFLQRLMKYWKEIQSTE